MNEMIEALRAITYNGISPKVLVDCCGDNTEYNEMRQVFNRKFQFKPAAIVFCTCSEHVAAVITITRKYDWEIRVRSGGHDHEGECSATDAVLIDFADMKKVDVDTQAGVARIQPGIPFQELIPLLNSYNVSLPHGTCGTVRIAGFTFGGGWGPWTRGRGMCCESLAGATIVLGNGEIRQLSEDSTDESDRDLLWALRGGGGMSYGVVTELVIKTFPLPPSIIQFNVVWTTSPALSVLKAWEDVIAPDKNEALVGTNLKIMGKPYDGGPVETSVHECTFYGYYAGSIPELEADLDRWFKEVPPTEKNIPKPPLTAKNTKGIVTNTGGAWAFSGWDRVSVTAKKQKMLGSRQVGLIQPDTDEPGPHKITSRLVKEEGLDDEGRKTLIRSLESTLIHPEDTEAALYCYVTLGAIWGPYYKNYNPADHPLGSAFPYKKRPYTIQYQAWWDEGTKDIEAGKKYDVNLYTNEAQDWIEECRQRNFPQTEGAFISFKDSSVPTREYFLQFFERLRQVKLNYSKDPDNRLRSRKTII